MIWIKLCIILISAELWRMSGSSKYRGKWHRCWVLPFLLSWYFAWQCDTFKGGLLIFLGLFAGWQLFRVGYGIVDKDEGGIPIASIDKRGSFLGRIFITGEATRAVAGILYSLPALIIDRGFVFLLYITLNANIGWRGSIYKLKARLYERLIGGCVATIILKEEVLKWLMRN